jgi:protein-disulfide isomerase
MTREALCAALFRADGPGVPVAVFSDYRCPTCPALASRLRGLGGPALSITWHEWPILGAASVFSAKVALAAGMQGRHDEMHAYLTRRFLRPSEAGAREAAKAIGLDAERLAADMQGPVVVARLAETARLAALFGFRGTPSAVVGGTATEGLVDTATLRRLAEAGGGPCRG